MNRGDAPNEMGGNLNAIDLGAGRTVSQVTAGGGFSCAVLDNGSAKCWGRNDDGILGNYWCTNPEGDFGLCSDPNYPIPTRGYGLTSGQMGDALPVVALGAGRTVRALSSGDSSTCALLDNGQLKCWGADDFGQLGDGKITPTGTSPAQMGNALPAVDFGSQPAIQSFSTGNYHNCVVFSSNAMKCWGDNHFGELGLGDTNHRGDAPGEMGNALPLLSL